MNPDSHLNRAKELRGTIQKLLTTPEEDVAGIIELIFGMCHHIIAYGAAIKFGSHSDTHAGASKHLREHGAGEIADAFDQIGSLRQGRFYGSKGNGPAVRKCQELSEKIWRWTGS